MQITKASIEDVRSSKSRIAAIRNLLAPSYEDAGALIDRELDNNTEIYLLTDDTGRLNAFFMVGWGWPAPQVAGKFPVYLGLSGCREEGKGRGLTIRLYQRFIRDALAWEARHQEKLLVWGTTAHPLILAICYRFFDVHAPLPDGVCSEEACRLAGALRDQLPEQYRAPSHPFVFRQIAVATRYADRELVRVEAARSRLDYDHFQEWEIDERQGDRLLIMGGVQRGDAG